LSVTAKAQPGRSTPCPASGTAPTNKMTSGANTVARMTSPLCVRFADFEIIPE
jgi:hypothetical protein